MFKVPQEEERSLRHFGAMTTYQVPTGFPKPLAQRAARKARREKRRIILARGSEGGIRFMTISEFNLARVRGEEVERIGQINPMGVFNY